MSKGENNLLRQMETTCGSLLHELQVLELHIVTIFFLSFSFSFASVFSLYAIFNMFYWYICQIIWDEVGECDAEKDRMLLELERECLEVYRRKVDQANKCRAQLRQEIADAEAELAAICSAMGERPVHIRQVRKTKIDMCY